VHVGGFDGGTEFPLKVLVVFVVELDGGRQLLFTEEGLAENLGQQRNDPLIGKEKVKGSAELTLGLEGLELEPQLADAGDLDKGGDGQRVNAVFLGPLRILAN